MYIYRHIDICIYRYLHAYIYFYLHAHIYVHICMLMIFLVDEELKGHYRQSQSSYLSSYIYTCICIFMHMYTYIHIHVCIDIYIYTYLYSCIYVYIFMLLNLCVNKGLKSCYKMTCSKVSLPLILLFGIL